MNIGSGFSGETKNGRKNIGISLDDSILELYPVLKNVRFKLWFAPKDERKTENSPAWTLAMYKPMKKDDSETSSKSTAEYDEEIPF